MAPSSSNPSPSAARRKKLRDNDSVTIRINSNVPVGHYTETARSLHSAFVDAVSRRDLDAAYLFGIRYATLVVEKLPQHRNFRGSIRLKVQVETVMKSLEQVTERMDAEELVKERQRKEEEEEEKRREALKQKQLKETRQDSIEKSAMAKLKQMQSARDLNARTKSENQASNDIRKTKSSDAMAAERRVVSPTRRVVSPSTRRPQPDAAAPPRAAVPESAPLSNRSLSSTSQDDLHGAVPLRSGEAAVIELLNEMIRRHCDRLPRLQQQMNQLKRAAVQQYKAGHVRSALHRVNQRRKIQKQYTTTERAVFGMETQIMMIQAAASDRDAAVALQQAESAIASLEQKHAVEATHDAIVEDLEELQEVNEALAEDWNPADEEDLLRELQEDSADETASVADESLLVLPKVPTTESTESHSFFWTKKKKSKEPKESEPTIAASFM